MGRWQRCRTCLFTVLGHDHLEGELVFFERALEGLVLHLELFQLLVLRGQTEDQLLPGALLGTLSNRFVLQRFFLELDATEGEKHLKKTK